MLRRLALASLLAASVVTTGCATSSYATGVGVSFYDDLAPYGVWWTDPYYGSVFSPYAVRGWQPYTYGHWGWSAFDGWTWFSYDPFGWATDHYGRWHNLGGRWAWQPGNVWAPSWVSWRTGPGYVGWAPYGYTSYVFVRDRDFLARDVGSYRVRDAPTRVVHRAPPRADIERAAGRSAVVSRSDIEALQRGVVATPRDRVFEERREAARAAALQDSARERDTRERAESTVRGPLDVPGPPLDARVRDPVDVRGPGSTDGVARERARQQALAESRRRQVDTRTDAMRGWQQQRAAQDRARNDAMFEARAQRQAMQRDAVVRPRPEPRAPAVERSRPPPRAPAARPPPSRPPQPAAPAPSARPRR